ncbi:MAG: hypothetical protein KAT25_03780 [Sulfuriflexus sp.]|nr:hypothetical protein [Sulfuriflexus sp.]
MTEDTKVGLTQFQKDVDDAKLLLHYAYSSGWVKGPGKKIEDEIIKTIEMAFDVAQNDTATAEQRSEFEIAYRDLSNKLSPVNAETLRVTSEESSKRTVLTPFKGVSRAGRWSRMLMLYTFVFASAILFNEYLNITIGQFTPPDDEPFALLNILNWHIALSVMVPFLYGGLGACVFLLRSCHLFIHKRTFDERRISEYLNRILLGLVSGGVITLFVNEVAGDGDDVIQLSAAALGFLTGYNNEFLFQTLERIAQALFPKIGVNSIRKEQEPPPAENAQATEFVKDLLVRHEKATDQASKDLIAEILKKAKDSL